MAVIHIKLLLILVVFSFKLSCAELSITNPADLYDRLDRSIKAKDQAKIESLLLHPIQEKLTSNHRNNLLERAFLFHADVEMANFLLQKQNLLKANKLGIHDILRLSIIREQVDAATFILFQITDEQLQPERDVVEACYKTAQEKQSPEFTKVFSSYLYPKAPIDKQAEEKNV